VEQLNRPNADREMFMSANITEKRVAIIGSTGSIGRSTCEVVDALAGRLVVVGLAAGSNGALLAEQVERYRPHVVAVADARVAERYRDALTRYGSTLFAGPDGVVQVAAWPEADTVVCGAVGASGLDSLFAAIEAGHTVALANKEPLVMAGELVMARARECGATVLPVDSEHNALFQCLENRRSEEVRRVVLTASGGPFYRATRAELADISPKQAVNHPTWRMGPKISVDSATLMNKGLEVIEAMSLFGLPLDRIEILIHPQSIIHGMVEFVDGGVMAYVSRPDMRVPIQFALTWPDRIAAPFDRIDIVGSGPWTFAVPEVTEFPCLDLARRAAQAGGTFPAVLNAANEVAVEAFIQKEIGFLDIARVVERTVSAHTECDSFSLETVKMVDRWARTEAGRLVAERRTGREL